MSVHEPPDRKPDTTPDGGQTVRDPRLPIPEPPGLFPLPLTPFEELMLGEEADGYPITFYLQLRIKGAVRPEAAAPAMRDALSRHPLLACRIQQTWRGCQWVWAGEPTPLADMDAESWRAQQPWTQRIDLTKAPGLRIWGQSAAQSSLIVFQFHHACCDGIAAAQFLEDFAVGYSFYHDHDSDGACDAASPDYRPLDLLTLRTRNSPAGRRVANLPGTFLSRTLSVARYSLRYLRRAKLSLTGSSPGSSSADNSDFGLHIVSLSRRETRALRTAAKTSNATVSDLVIRELLLVAKQWHGDADRGKSDTLCVQLPNSLRGPQDDRLPACNVLGNIFIERTPSEIGDADTLLESVRDEMQFVHQSQAGWIFVQSLTVLRRIPGLLKLIQATSRNRCMSTMILSHMGNLMNSIGARLPKQDGHIRIGNLLVEDVCGIGPLRPGTNVVVSTMMFQGCLLIGMRCASQHFSSEDTQELLTAFVTRLQHTAEESSR